MALLSDAQIEEFRNEVLTYGREHFRVMPWRNIDDAYGVLVSEVMLQQTQVVRVLERWPRWMAKFPTVDALAAASTYDVLQEWQGMGYNRRALALKAAAEVCAAKHGGVVPAGYDALVALPGVGPTTSAGVRAFAYNLPGVYLETNVRTVMLHAFFPDAEGVTDKKLRPYVEETCTDDPRSWYYALLDYGAHLKAELGKLADPSRRSAAYTKQSTFEGSHRQKRAELLRIVLGESGIASEEAYAALNAQEAKAKRPRVSLEEFERIIAELVAEKFILLEDDRLLVR